ncbi:polycomb group RING finger protein 5 isoform X3, partial [Scomber scombrus]
FRALPGWLVAPAHRCSLLPACWLLGGLGQIRADQFRVSLPVHPEQTEREDPAVSWWTFLLSCGIHKSGDRGRESVDGGDLSGSRTDHQTILDEDDDATSGSIMMNKHTGMRTTMHKSSGSSADL